MCRHSSRTLGWAGVAATRHFSRHSGESLRLAQRLVRSNLALLPPPPPLATHRPPLSTRLSTAKPLPDRFFHNLNSSRENGCRAKPSLASLSAILRSQDWEPGQATGWDDQQVERNYGILLKSGTAWKNLPLVCVSVELLAAHQPDTVRGNMYLVVSHGWLPDTGKKSYARIQRLLNRLRLGGSVPFDWIVDNVRSTIKPSSWSGLEEFTEVVRSAYRKNFWAQLPEYVEVIVEKDTVAGKIAPVARACRWPRQ